MTQSNTQPTPMPEPNKTPEVKTATPCNDADKKAEADKASSCSTETKA